MASVFDLMGSRRSRSLRPKDGANEGSSSCISKQSGRD